jgi:hypothetical protein
LRCYISVLGAIGFFIKPHYAGLPALLLLYAALRTQSLKPLWSCETAALLVIGCANLALVLWWYPGWLTCARWATDLYGAYQRSSMSAVLAAPPFPIVATSALLVFTLAGYRRDFGRAVLPLILMSGYGILAYCFQAKGWAYQLLPSTIPLFILIGLATGYSWNARHESPGTRILTACAMSVASLAAVAVAFANTPTNLPRWSMLVKSPIGQAFAIASPGDHVYAFSTTMVPVFPTVLSLNLQWSSRFPSLWPLAGIEWHRQHPDAEDTNALASYSTQLKQMVLADLRRDRPGVVLLDRRVGQFGLPPGYDILGFFLDDAGFRALWRDYRIIGEHRDYIIYARRQ